MARSEKEPGRSYRMDQTTCSTYYHGLEEQAKSRYREKLAKIGALSDPYLSSTVSSSVDWQDWPDVQYPDIFSYLIETPSLYTHQQLKAYKSLEAWVGNLVVCRVPSRQHVFMVTACVRHSQRVSATPVHARVAVEQVGVVLYAHCTCMAGLGSHIAAILFTLDANTRTKQTCTSLPCSWLPPTLSSVQIADIDFSAPMQKRKKTLKQSSSEHLHAHEHCNSVPSSLAELRPSAIELNKFTVNYHSQGNLLFFHLFLVTDII